MSRIIETLDGVFFSKSDFERFNPSNCLGYFLSDRETALLLSLLRYAEWESRWEDRDIDRELVTELEDKLLTVCDIGLQLNRIASALYLEPDPGQLAILAEAGIADDVSIATLMSGEETDYTAVLTEIATVLGYVVAVA